MVERLEKLKLQLKTLQDEVKQEEERIEQGFDKVYLGALLNPNCDGVTAHAINEAGWKCNNLLSQHGEVSGHQFNNLKGILCEVINTYNQALKYTLETKNK